MAKDTSTLKGISHEKIDLTGRSALEPTTAVAEIRSSFGAPEVKEELFESPPFIEYATETTIPTKSDASSISNTAGLNDAMKTLPSMSIVRLRSSNRTSS